MAEERAQLAASGYLPDPDGVVGAARSEQSPVGTESHRHYGTPVAGENARFPPSAQLLLEKEEPAKGRGKRWGHLSRNEMVASATARTSVG
jgi:hypothetical protein